MILGHTKSYRCIMQLTLQTTNQTDKNHNVLLCLIIYFHFKKAAYKIVWSTCTMKGLIERNPRHQK